MCVEPAGMDRVVEALEANDWSGGDGDGGGDDDDDAVSFGSFEDGADDPLKPIGDEMGREMFGLHNAIFGEEDEEEDEELQVEKLEAMMLRMAALKGMSICVDV